MTISSTTNRVAYTGNGVTTAFAFPYKFLDDADLKVYVDDVLKTLTTDYTVSGEGEDSGGTVTFVVAPANSTSVVILRDPAVTQGLDLVENDPLPAESVENAFDKLTMIAQRLDDRLDRAFVLTDSDVSSPDLTIPSPVADEVIKWNATGTGLESATVAELGAITLPLAVNQGGTGSSSAAAARTSLGARGVEDDITLTAGKVIIFEGTTDDAFETTLTVVDPTADQTITLPNMTGQAAVQARGTDIASASTINLTTATGDIVDVTGTTGITAITLADGLERQVRFTDALTLTNGASLVLPSGANITTAAGDFAVFRGYAAGVVRCVSYTKASGQAVVGAGGITLGTAVASTSGTSIDFTSLPAGLKRIAIMLDGVSTNGADPLCVQIGDSGGVETTGYVGAYFSSSGLTTNNMSSSFVIGAPGAANTANGIVILSLLDASTNTWAAAINVGLSTTTVYFASGAKSLSATLDRVRITTTGGTNAFDAGKINIAYE